MIGKIMLVTVGAVIGAAPVTAQGWIDPVPGIERPGSLIRTRTHVQVSLEGRVAHVTVEEWFHNNGSRLAEGDYLFPLPGEAVFTNVSLFQGDVELTGETMDAGRARSIYEEIVRRKRDPALIELVGQGLIRARVFPFAAGETRKVTLRFTQILDRTGDALRFRYSAGSPNTGNRIGNPTAVNATPRHPISFELVAPDAERFGEPFSPTNELDRERRAGRLTVRSANITRDLTLFLPFQREQVGITFATHRPNASEPGFFMMTLSPNQADRATVPRDITVVLDVSGSMSGTKLVQAKAALRQLLSSLDRHDRFRMTAFSNSVKTHSNAWLSANERNLQSAGDWVEQLHADGGTNISAALTEALSLPSPEDRLPIVLFLTDGLPSIGEQNPERIAGTASTQRGRTRIFAFGLGYDVNTQLLDLLSAEGHGSTEYVAPGESVERSLGTLANKIKHPVLTDLSIGQSPVHLTEIYPRTLPDLFAGEELVIFGRYERSRERSTELTLTGTRTGRIERFSTAVEFPDHELSNEYIPRLWAARKLGFLTRTVRLEGATPQLTHEIRETAMRYGLLSEYTSYLVQEPEFVAQDQLQGGAGQHRDRSIPRSPLRAGTPRPTRQEVNTGQAAVESARRAGEQRVVSNESDLKALQDSGDKVGNALNRQRVAGRTFELRNEVWTDLLTDDQIPVARIKPFSVAYFALLDEAPELEAWLSHFETVLLAGAERNILITNDGEQTLSTPELSRLVRQYRGR